MKAITTYKHPTRAGCPVHFYNRINLNRKKIINYLKIKKKERNPPKKKKTLMKHTTDHPFLSLPSFNPVLKNYYLKHHGDKTQSQSSQQGGEVATTKNKKQQRVIYNTTWHSKLLLWVLILQHLQLRFEWCNDSNLKGMFWGLQVTSISRRLWLLIYSFVCWPWPRHIHTFLLFYPRIVWCRRPLATSFFSCLPWNRLGEFKGLEKCHCVKIMWRHRSLDGDSCNLTSANFRLVT